MVLGVDVLLIWAPSRLATTLKQCKQRVVLAEQMLYYDFTEYHVMTYRKLNKILKHIYF